MPLDVMRVAIDHLVAFDMTLTSDIDTFHMMSTRLGHLGSLWESSSLHASEVFFRPRLEQESLGAGFRQL
jgi:hypothetical protein